MDQDSLFNLLALLEWHNVNSLSSLIAISIKSPNARTVIICITLLCTAISDSRYLSDRVQIDSMPSTVYVPLDCELRRNVNHFDRCALQLDTVG